MRNRNLIQKKLNLIQGKTTTAKMLVKTPSSPTEYLQILENISELINEIQHLVELEPLDAYELNKF